MSGDLHSPTDAGPGFAPAEPAPPATSFEAPDPQSRPELLAGAAFAGGLVAALILRRLGRD